MVIFLNLESESMRATPDFKGIVGGCIEYQDCAEGMADLSEVGGV
jgi:hypothetical protein